MCFFNFLKSSQLPRKKKYDCRIYITEHKLINRIFLEKTIIMYVYWKILNIDFFLFAAVDLFFVCFISSIFLKTDSLYRLMVVLELTL